MKCLDCGRESCTSEIFYEVNLPIVKNKSSLNDSFDEYLAQEVLDGDNQYFCQTCQVKRDASRFIRFKTLPTILQVHLMRFVYTPQTDTKKKIKHALYYPLTLEMDGGSYVLSAVLHHEGPLVNSGHYTVEVKIKEYRLGLMLQRLVDL
jgi:ubiquitin carboxyl-terminal hydrolase 48